MEALAAFVDELAQAPPWLAALLIVLGTLLSEDLACIGAALAAAQGAMSLPLALSSAAFGVWIGDAMLWAIGKTARGAVPERGLMRRLVDPGTLERCRQGFSKSRFWWILLTRVLPGSRTPTYILAGALGVPFSWFGPVTALCVAVWTPLLFFVAHALGDQALLAAERFGASAWTALLCTAALLWLLVRVALPCLRWEGRRRLVGRWRRLWRWEFWPAWCVYPPIVLGILLLAMRWRSLRCVTAANPAFPASGFVGESKAAILDSLAGAGDAVARHRLLLASDDAPSRLAQLEDFRRAHGLEYPLVLKPDAGQRGAGVSIVRDAAAARSYLERIAVDCIVQEHVVGPEFGVFYVRRPHEQQGWILSITQKEFPAVLGDGASSLERLILADPRAVCMADHYLATAGESARATPAHGQRVQLAEIGNHCRGTIFLDGGHLLTPALAAAIERIARACAGFHFGRFDLRAPSVEDFRRGVGLKVLELNGATSEATHIYDPRYGLLRAWATLVRQWALLFEIGAANMRAGHPTVGPLELWRAWREYGRAAGTHPLHRLSVPSAEGGPRRP